MALPVSLGDLNQTGKEIATLANSVIKLGNTWYNDTPETLQKLKSLADSAETDCLRWERLSRSTGLASNETVRSSLRSVKEQLKQEEARLTKMEGGWGRLCLCLRLWSDTSVPVGLTQSITSLKTAISSGWKAEDDNNELASKKARQLAKEATNFGFTRERKYVRIPSIEKQVKDFLNQESCGETRVALLYGSAGLGKSSMARNLALDYQDEAEAPIPSEHRVSTSDGEGYSSGTSTGCCKFDRVYYLDCGRNADWRTKQAELLQMIPEARVSDADQDGDLMQAEVESGKQGINQKLKKKMDKGSKNEESDVEALLRWFLKNTRSLIILVDVWESELLNRMVGVCGSDMRVLVTSGTRSLSYSLTGLTKPLSILMEVLPEDSRRIFMVLTNLPENNVKQEVQECMNKLLQKVKGHPHALAAFATQIDPDNNTEVQQWRDVITRYEECLGASLDQNAYLGNGGRPEDRQGVLGAIEVKFAGLSTQEKRILALTVLLRGPLVQQDVVQFFFQALHLDFSRQDKSSDESYDKPSSRDFWSARKRLVNLQWIHTRKDGKWGSKKWSIDPLDEIVIKRKLSDDIQRILGMINGQPTTMIQGLIEYHPQPNAVLLLAAAFFKDNVLKDAVGEKYGFQTRVAQLCVENSYKQTWHPVSRVARLLRSVKREKHSVEEDSDEDSVEDSEEDSEEEDSKKDLLKQEPEPGTSQGSLEKGREIRRPGRPGLKWRIAVGKIVDMRENLARNFTIFYTSTILSMISALTNSVEDRWTELHQKSATQVLLVMMYTFLDFSEDLEKTVFGDAVKNLLTSSLSHQQWFGLLHYLKTSDRGVHIKEDCMVSVLEMFIETTKVRDTRSWDSLKNVASLTWEQARILLVMGNMECWKTRDVKTLKLFCPLRKKRSVKSMLPKIWISPNSALAVSCCTAMSFLRCLGRHDHSKIKRSGKESRQSTRQLSRIFGRGRVRELITYVEQVFVSTSMETAGPEEIDRLLDSLTSILRASIWGLGNISKWEEHFSTEALVALLLLIFVEADEDDDVVARALQQTFLRLNKFWQYGPQRCQYRIYLKDWDGALQDVAEFSKRDSNSPDGFWYQERGTVKRMMGNPLGALEDLEKADHLMKDDYEILKQRGYVKFLLDDKEGARADAEKALAVQPSNHRLRTYCHSNYGTSSVEYLDFQL